MAEPQVITTSRVILITDIHDFSIVMAGMGWEVHELIQEVYERLGEIAVGHQGEILKYVGDTIVAIFPAGSEAAVIQCAAEMRAAYSEILLRRHITHESELEVGIGSGDVMEGVFGHPSLRMRDVFGEEVNRTAMIMHHRGIAITERVFDAVRLTHQTSPLPDVTVKWQAAPLKFWEITG